jgi:tight adherence protein C
MFTLAAIISAELLTKCAIFGGVACGAWLLLDLISKGKPRAQSRLDDIRDPGRRRDNVSRGVTKRSDGMARLLERASPRMAKPLQPKSDADVGKLRAKLNYAGFRGESAPSMFLGLKTICLVLGFLAGGGGLFMTKGFTTESVMYTVGAAGVAFYLPEVVLWFFKR